VIGFGGTLTRRDMTKALHTRGLVGFALFWLVIGLLNLAFAATRGEGWLVGIILTAFGALLLVMPWFWAARQLETNALLRAAQTGSADESHIVIESEFGRTDLPWSAFHRMTVSRDVVRLYQANVAFNIISRSFFATDADWDAFCALVRAQPKPKRVTTPTTLIAAAVWLGIIIVVFIVRMFYNR
jgi:hypothetical protein